jgi:uncharacterized protein (DUF433 family)
MRFSRRLMTSLLASWALLSIERVIVEHPGIETNPNVCGGEPCVAGTRIPVWLLEQARRLGTSEADLLRAYPSLRAGDVANAWAYVRSHHEEIEEQIHDNESA